MAKGARHVLQELVVLVQFRQHSRNAARQIPDLVTGVDLAAQHAGLQPSVLIDRGARFATQLTNAPCQSPGECEQCNKHRQQARQRKDDGLLKRQSLERENFIDVLFHHHGAEHRVRGHDRVCGHDDVEFADPTPQRDRVAREGGADDLVRNRLSVLSGLLDIPVLPHHQAMHERTHRCEPALRGIEPAALWLARARATTDAPCFRTDAVLRVDHHDARPGIAEPLNDVQHLRRAQHHQIETLLAGFRQGLRNGAQLPGLRIIDIDIGQTEITPRAEHLQRHAEFQLQTVVGFFDVALDAIIRRAFLGETPIRIHLIRGGHPGARKRDADATIFSIGRDEAQPYVIGVVQAQVLGVAQHQRIITNAHEGVQLASAFAERQFEATVGELTFAIHPEAPGVGADLAPITQTAVDANRCAQRTDV